MNPEISEQMIMDTVILPAIRTASQRVPRFSLQSAGESTPLYGSQGASLDSMGLVSFIFILEEEFQKSLGRPIKISAQDVLRGGDNPFSSLSALARFLKSKAGEA
jgi:acyl carrier protein